MSEDHTYIVFGKGLGRLYNRSFGSSQWGEAHKWKESVEAVHGFEMEIVSAYPFCHYRDRATMKRRPEGRVFTVTSGALRVTDPCYTMNTWCAGTLENVRNGKWTAVLEYSDEKDWGVRVSQLIVAHIELDSILPEGINSEWEKTNLDIGVDSGQAGFFDLNAFPNRNKCDEKFYDTVCEGTIGPEQFVMLTFGVASHSGFGDGGYNCYVLRGPDKQIVAAKIVFIGDEDDEEEDEDAE